MALPRRTSTLEPLSSNAVNRRSLLGGPARNGSRPSLGPGYGDAGVVKRTSQVRENRHEEWKQVA